MNIFIKKLGHGNCIYVEHIGLYIYFFYHVWNHLDEYVTLLVIKLFYPWWIIFFFLSVVHHQYCTTTIHIYILSALYCRSFYSVVDSVNIYRTTYFLLASVSSDYTLCIFYIGWASKAPTHKIFQVNEYWIYPWNMHTSMEEEKKGKDLYTIIIRLWDKNNICK